MLSTGDALQAVESTSSYLLPLAVVLFGYFVAMAFVQEALLAKVVAGVFFVGFLLTSVYFQGASSGPQNAFALLLFGGMVITFLRMADVGFHSLYESLLPEVYVMVLYGLPLAGLLGSVYLLYAGADGSPVTKMTAARAVAVALSATVGLYMATSSLFAETSQGFDVEGVVRGYVVPQVAVLAALYATAAMEPGGARSMVLLGALVTGATWLLYYWFASEAAFGTSLAAGLVLLLAGGYYHSFFAGADRRALLASGAALLVFIVVVSYGHLSRGSRPAERYPDVFHFHPLVYGIGLVTLFATLSQSVSAEAYLAQAIRGNQVQYTPTTSPADALEGLEVELARTDLLPFRMDSSSRMIFDSMRKVLQEYQKGAGELRAALLQPFERVDRLGPLDRNSLHPGAGPDPMMFRAAFALVGEKAVRDVPVVDKSLFHKNSLAELRLNLQRNLYTDAVQMKEYAVVLEEYYNDAILGKMHAALGALQRGMVGALEVYDANFVKNLYDAYLHLEDYSAVRDSILTFMNNAPAFVQIYEQPLRAERVADINNYLEDAKVVLGVVARKLSLHMQYRPGAPKWDFQLIAVVNHQTILEQVHAALRALLGQELQFENHVEMHRFIVNLRKLYKTTRPPAAGAAAAADLQTQVNQLHTAIGTFHEVAKYMQYVHLMGLLVEDAREEELYRPEEFAAQLQALQQEFLDSSLESFVREPERHALAFFEPLRKHHREALGTDSFLAASTRRLLDFNDQINASGSDHQRNKDRVRNENFEGAIENLRAALDAKLVDEWLATLNAPLAALSESLAEKSPDLHGLVQGAAVHPDPLLQDMQRRRTVPGAVALSAQLRLGLVAQDMALGDRLDRALQWVNDNLRGFERDPWYAAAVEELQGLLRFWKEQLRGCGLLTRLRRRCPESLPLWMEFQATFPREEVFSAAAQQPRVLERLDALTSPALVLSWIERLTAALGYRLRARNWGRDRADKRVERMVVRAVNRNAIRAMQGNALFVLHSSLTALNHALYAVERHHAPGEPLDRLVRAFQHVLFKPQLVLQSVQDKQYTPGNYPGPSSDYEVLYQGAMPRKQLVRTEPYAAQFFQDVFAPSRPQRVVRSVNDRLLLYNRAHPLYGPEQQTVPIYDVSMAYTTDNYLSAERIYTALSPTLRTAALGADYVDTAGRDFPIQSRASAHPPECVATRIADPRKIIVGEGSLASLALLPLHSAPGRTVERLEDAFLSMLLLNPQMQRRVLEANTEALFEFKRLVREMYQQYLERFNSTVDVDADTLRLTQGGRVKFEVLRTMLQRVRAALDAPSALATPANVEYFMIWANKAFSLFTSDFFTYLLHKRGETAPAPEAAIGGAGRSAKGSVPALSLGERVGVLSTAVVPREYISLQRQVKRPVRGGELVASLPDLVAKYNQFDHVRRTVDALQAVRSTIESMPPFPNRLAAAQAALLQTADALFRGIMPNPRLRIEATARSIAEYIAKETASARTATARTEIIPTIPTLPTLQLPYPKHVSNVISNLQKFVTDVDASIKSNNYSTVLKHLQDMIMNINFSNILIGTVERNGRGPQKIFAETVNKCVTELVRCGALVGELDEARVEGLADEGMADFARALAAHQGAVLADGCKAAGLPVPEVNSFEGLASLQNACGRYIHENKHFTDIVELARCHAAEAAIRTADQIRNGGLLDQPTPALGAYAANTLQQDIISICTTIKNTVLSINTKTSDTTVRSFFDTIDNNISNANITHLIVNNPFLYLREKLVNIYHLTEMTTKRMRIDEYINIFADENSVYEMLAQHLLDFCEDDEKSISNKLMKERTISSHVTSQINIVKKELTTIKTSLAANAALVQSHVACEKLMGQVALFKSGLQAVDAAARGSSAALPEGSTWRKVVRAALLDVLMGVRKQLQAVPEEKAVARGAAEAVAAVLERNGSDWEVASRQFFAETYPNVARRLQVARRGLAAEHFSRNGEDVALRAAALEDGAVGREELQADAEALRQRALEGSLRPVSLRVADRPATVPQTEEDRLHNMRTAALRTLQQLDQPADRIRLQQAAAVASKIVTVPFRFRVPPLDRNAHQPLYKALQQHFNNNTPKTTELPTIEYSSYKSSFTFQPIFKNNEEQTFATEFETKCKTYLNTNQFAFTTQSSMTLTHTDVQNIFLYNIFKHVYVAYKALNKNEIVNMQFISYRNRTIIQYLIDKIKNADKNIDLNLLYDILFDTATEDGLVVLAMKTCGYKYGQENGWTLESVGSGGLLRRVEEQVIVLATSAAETYSFNLDSFYIKELLALEVLNEHKKEKLNIELCGQHCIYSSVHYSIIERLFDDSVPSAEQVLASPLAVRVFERLEGQLEDELDGSADDLLQVVMNDESSGSGAELLKREVHAAGRGAAAVAIPAPGHERDAVLGRMPAEIGGAFSAEFLQETAARLGAALAALQERATLSSGVGHEDLRLLQVFKVRFLERFGEFELPPGAETIRRIEELEPPPTEDYALHSFLVQRNQYRRLRYLMYRAEMELLNQPLDDERVHLQGVVEIALDESQVRLEDAPLSLRNLLVCDGEGVNRGNKYHSLQGVLLRNAACFSATAAEPVQPSLLVRTEVHTDFRLERRRLYKKLFYLDGRMETVAALLHVFGRSLVPVLLFLEEAIGKSGSALSRYSGAPMEQSLAEAVRSVGEKLAALGGVLALDDFKKAASVSAGAYPATATAASLEKLFEKGESKCMVQVMRSLCRVFEGDAPLDLRLKKALRDVRESVIQGCEAFKGSNSVAEIVVPSAENYLKHAEVATAIAAIRKMAITPLPVLREYVPKFQVQSGFVLPEEIHSKKKSIEAALKAYESAPVRVKSQREEALNPFGLVLVGEQLTSLQAGRALLSLIEQSESAKQAADRSMTVVTNCDQRHFRADMARVRALVLEREPSEEDRGQARAALTKWLQLADELIAAAME